MSVWLVKPLPILDYIDSNLIPLPVSVLDVEKQPMLDQAWVRDDANSYLVQIGAHSQ